MLPALDQWIDDASAELIPKAHPEHPQFGLAKLLAALGVAGYAYYDTAQVARNAIEFFGSDLVRELESAPS